MPAQPAVSDRVKSDTVTQPEPPAKPAQPLPWSSPAEVADKQGLSMMLFSHPGIGKTTLGLTMLHSKDGGPMLIVNFDEELRSLSDLGPDDDVMIWPGERQRGKITGWSQIETFTSKLLSGSHPFKAIQFDTLNSLYDKFALPQIMAQNPESRDPRQLFGKANDLVLGLIRSFTGVAREQGINVLFCVHAEEKQVGENGPLLVRPKITPGVVLGLNQMVSIIGYLHPPLQGVRKLQLSPSARVMAKIHQPRRGPQVPGEIKKPDLGRLINHLKYHVPYPSEKKADE